VDILNWTTHAENMDEERCREITRRMLRVKHTDHEEIRQLVDMFYVHRCGDATGADTLLQRRQTIVVRRQQGLTK